MIGILVAGNLDFRCFEIINLLSEDGVDFIVDIDFIEVGGDNLTAIGVDGLVAHGFYYSY